MHPRHLLLSIACVALAGLSQAQVDDSARRAAIAAEKQAVQSRYEQAVRTCEAQFAVTACFDQAKRERRRELDRLAGEQAKLDQAVRQRRAAERRARIDEKQQAAARLGPAPAASAPPKSAQRAARAAAPPASAMLRHRQDIEERAAAAASAAAKRQSAAIQRRQDAQAHAEAVRRRNDERARHRTPAAPLPPASAASASRLR